MKKQRLIRPGMIVVASLFACLAAGPAAAKIYKCVDPEGHVTYSGAECQQTDPVDRLIDNEEVSDASGLLLDTVDSRESGEPEASLVGTAGLDS